MDPCTRSLHGYMDDPDACSKNKNLRFLCTLSSHVNVLNHEIVAILQMESTHDRCFMYVNQASKWKKRMDRITGSVQFIKDPSKLELSMITYLYRYNLLSMVQLLDDIRFALHGYGTHDMNEFTPRRYVEASRIYDEMHDDLQYASIRLMSVVAMNGSTRMKPERTATR